ncbi:hypothetical protein [Lentzea sp. NPDC004782]|uniref:hypothetical protein n=1 Tax=Lentzea sp. NPDC004782 TaxID=3154458 RepID=UPI0033B10EFB
MRLSNWAHELAEAILCKNHSHHWEYTKLVVHRAEVLGPILLPEDEADVLSAAAWLHRVGAAVELQETGFVPLDSARYIASMTTFPRRVVALVAHQSSAATKAVERGLSAEMTCYADEETLTRDALWHCVTPVLPANLELAHRARQEASTEFLGKDHPIALAHEEGQTRIREASSRVMLALETSDHH